MQTTTQNPPVTLRDKALRLAVGRVLALVLLAAASWFWRGDGFPASLGDLLHQPHLIFIVALVVALVLLAAPLDEKHLRKQIAVQFVLDGMLISWLVLATGDVQSPYITLYTVLICLASIFFGANGAILTAAGCTAAFTLLSALVMFNLMPQLSEAGAASISRARVLQIIGFHDVAFLAVGLLVAQLGARHSRSRIQLQEAAQNLADLQRLHERIVQSIRSGLVTTDLTGKIYLFNRAAEEITGYKSEELQGWTIFDLLGNIEHPIAVSLEAAKTGEQPPRFEIDFLTPEDFAIRLGYGISPLFDEAGETTGLIITFQDLTDLRSMEESIRRKDRLAAVGRVAAGLAHEIRNPLGAMRGAVQVLQAGIAKDSAHGQLMDIVLRESDRLNTIITNFLSYARPRAAEMVRTDVRETIRDSVTLLRHSPDVKADHEIVEDLPADSLFALADAAQLKQVFWNLARNAVQAMPGGGRLTVKLAAAAPNRLQITFADTGGGMPPEQVEKLFEPFSASTTGGTGLGLSIVYQIVRDHNGTINVRSQENKGTTITVELPSETKIQNSQPPGLKPEQELKLPPVPLDNVKLFDDSKIPNESKQTL